LTGQSSLLKLLPHVPFVCAAALSREALDGRSRPSWSTALLRGTTATSLPLLSSLVDAMSARDRALLDELERIVAEKRDAPARS
jgi:hypothetical protein